MRLLDWTITPKNGHGDVDFALITTPYPESYDASGGVLDIFYKGYSQPAPARFQNTFSINGSGPWMQLTGALLLASYPTWVGVISETLDADGLSAQITGINDSMAGLVIRGRVRAADNSAAVQQFTRCSVLV